MSKSKTIPATGKIAVQAMRPDSDDVEPPNEWVKGTPFGFLASSAAKAGNLARLGDVLFWLADRRGLPVAEAARVLSDGLPDDVMSHVYQVRASDFAELVPGDCMFGLATLEAKARNDQARAAAAQASAFRGYVRTIGPASEPGRPALLACLASWSAGAARADKHPANNVRTVGARLAVPIAKAYRWWGYGQQAAPAGADTETGGEPDVSTWAKVVAVYRDRPGVWTDEMCKTAAREEKRRKDRHEAGVRIAMGAELVNPDPEKDGLTAKTIGGVVARGNKLIAEEKATAEAAKAEAEKNLTLEKRRNSGGF